MASLVEYGPSEALKAKQAEYKKIAKEQQGAHLAKANEYRQQMPSIQQMQYDSFADRQKQALAQAMQKNAAGAQGRGLLYSGLKQSADQSNVADMANILANKRKQINNQTEETARGYEQSAIQGGMELAGMEQEANVMEARRQALANRQMVMEKQAQEDADYEDSQGMGQGIGTLAGAGIGLLATGGNPLGAMAGASAGSQLGKGVAGTARRRRQYT